MFRKILLEYDGSDLSQRAFERCLQLAKESGKLAIVGVVRPSAVALDFGTQAILDQAQDELAAQLARLERRARLAGIEVLTQARFGDPVQEIIRAAEEGHADLIVTSCAADRRFIRRFAVPRATSRLIAKARCAVLVIR